MIHHMDGGAGALLSHGLMDALNASAFEDCVTSGDGIASDYLFSRCMWLSGCVRDNASRFLQKGSMSDSHARICGLADTSNMLMIQPQGSWNGSLSRFTWRFGMCFMCAPGNGCEPQKSLHCPCMCAFLLQLALHATRQQVAACVCQSLRAAGHCWDS